MSCAGARLTEVACAVAAVLDRQADPADKLTVERAYSPDWLTPDFWVDNQDLLTRFKGRRAYVFGATQRQNRPATRAEDFNDYGIAVVCFELFTGPGELVPNDWLDGRIAWVERCVYDRLGSARDDVPELVDGAFPVAQEWTQVYSPDLLRQHKLFRSEVTITIRKVDDARFR